MLENGDACAGKVASYTHKSHILFSIFQRLGASKLFVFVGYVWFCERYGKGNWEVIEVAEGGLITTHL